MLSDRELTDNEGPPDFVPIVPALSHRRPSQGARDADHFRCGTFAELQERLQGMQGGADTMGSLGAQRASPPATKGAPLPACTPQVGANPDSHCGTEKHNDGIARLKPPALDQDMRAPEKQPLPDPAPPPPQEPRGGGAGNGRTLPVGSSEQSNCPCSAVLGHPTEQSMLTATVTLQQPVELNGEDELVFTVVEELPLSGLASPGRRSSSLASFGSNCSLQALASGSRPVSIISSINDEFDAYASPAPDGADGVAWSGCSHASSISSWLSEVGACSPDSRAPLRPPSRASPDPLSPHSPPGPGPPHSPHPREDAHSGRETRSQLPRLGSARSLHSSLPRKARTASATSRSPPSPGGPFGDPWLLRSEQCGSLPAPSANPAPMLASGWKLVESSEGAARASCGLGPAHPPPLRRGATTLGVTTPYVPGGDAEAAAYTGSPRVAAGAKTATPRPAGLAPPAPPVRKSSLESRSNPAPALPRAEEEVRGTARADHGLPRAICSLKSRPGKAEAAYHGPVQGSLGRSERPVTGGKAPREATGRPGRAVPRLGVRPTSPPAVPPCKGSPAKAVGICKAPTASAGKGRSLGAGGSRALASSMKLPPPAPTTRIPVNPMQSPRGVARSAPPGVGAKAGRGTIMGTKQALRAAHSRVHELAARGGPHWGGSADSDSGNDSGVMVGDERPGPALPSPYSTVTAPRRPQRCSSGHCSDASSVLSGELPPAMGRTALFNPSGASSGYESVVRDSEATGSASSAPDSVSDGAASPGARVRSLKSPKKRAVGRWDPGGVHGVGKPSLPNAYSWDLAGLPGGTSDL